MSDHSRQISNDSPYVPFQDEDEDDEYVEEGLSNSYKLHARDSRTAARKAASRSTLFSNRNHQYQSVQVNDLSDEDYNELDEAPASLMVEIPRTTNEGISTYPNRPRWFPNFGSRHKQQSPHMRPGMDIKDLTMWRWANVENLDNFLGQVYAYYQGHGIYCIFLGRLLNILKFAFVVCFSTFLVGCIDYPKLDPNNRLSDVVIPQCISQLSGSTKWFLFMCACFSVWQAIRLALEVRELTEMYNFYTHLLEIPDADIQTVSWQKVVNQIMKIRNNNPTTIQGHHLKESQQRLDAHNIANRIMRQENYLIALFNKDLLNLSIPFPFLREKQILTKTLEWNLNFCIIDYVFNNRGQVRKRFVKDVQREHLIRGLRRRFIFMGLMNQLAAPFIVIFNLITFFLDHLVKFRLNPTEMMSRRWSPFARWKFREFNELPHLFEMRLNHSYEHANKYLDQFPKKKTVLFMKFLSFVVGSFTAILLIPTITHTEFALNFEITPGKSLFFYCGVFASIFAVITKLIPDDTEVVNAEETLKRVVEYTHYMPSEWKENLHADEVRKEFGSMFELKVVLILQNILSVIFIPFILWLSLPDCSEQIVDFFREFTVHVDGVGYVCSFAVFDFKRHGNVKYGAPTEVANEYYLSKEGKMEKSFLNFKANHPDWEPTDPTGSMYLSRLAEFNNQIHHDRTSKLRESNIDYTPTRHNRRNSTVHFNTHGYSNSISHAPNYSHAYRSSLASNINDSLMTDQGGPSHGYHQRHTYATMSEPLNSSASEENHASELGDSYLMTGGKDGGDGTLSDSAEQDQPRQAGVFALLGQLYEHNNATM
ncbi:8765_t:CDS:10 [Paraglomus occultum]|uniref:Autophagy-related protein 9 n=1 Tax=Paraglomus occultum TaxID=144539 RepID=A0A9N9BB38_9GLOM|nr:8765_t:CDS:10 [Paraglomus occultum]